MSRVPQHISRAVFSSGSQEVVIPERTFVKSGGTVFPDRWNRTREVIGLAENESFDRRTPSLPRRRKAVAKFKSAVDITKALVQHLKIPVKAFMMQGSTHRLDQRFSSTEENHIE